MHSKWKLSCMISVSHVYTSLIYPDFSLAINLISSQAHYQNSFTTSLLSYDTYVQFIYVLYESKLYSHNSFAMFVQCLSCHLIVYVSHSTKFWQEKRTLANLAD